MRALALASLIVTTLSCGGQHPAQQVQAAVLPARSRPITTHTHWLRPSDPMTHGQCISRTIADTLWSVDSLDGPLELLEAHFPYYPQSLQERGRDGLVTFTFVIQPSGRVDPCTVKEITATHYAFIEPARASLLSLIYAPPTRRSHAVFVETATDIRFVVH